MLTNTTKHFFCYSAFQLCAIVLREETQISPLPASSSGAPGQVFRVCNYSHLLTSTCWRKFIPPGCLSALRLPGLTGQELWGWGWPLLPSHMDMALVIHWSHSRYLLGLWMCFSFYFCPLFKLHLKCTVRGFFICSRSCGTVTTMFSSLPKRNLIPICHRSSFLTLFQPLAPTNLLSVHRFAYSGHVSLHFCFINFEAKLLGARKLQIIFS